MYSTIFIGIIFVLIASIYGAPTEDRGFVIGTSVGGGIVGLIIVILDIIAIFELLSSSGRGMGSKLIWILIIVFFPVGGLILYLCCARNRTVHEVL